MIYEGILKGKYVELKSATVDDAEFTLLIRQDPKMTKYLPRLDITLEQQKDWISKQRKKEGDYFFVVWSLNTGKRIGTIGVYDIHGEEGESGRLALYGEVYEKIEAGMLMNEFKFNILNLKKTTAWVYCENSHVIKWNKSFGASFGKPRKHNDGKYIFDLVTTKEDNSIAMKKIQRMMECIKNSD